MSRARRAGQSAMGDWAADGVSSTGAAAWLDSPAFSLSSRLDPSEAAAVCRTLSDALGSSHSWATALLAASQAAPRSLSAQLSIASQALARGTDLPSATAQLPPALAGWLALAGSSAQPHLVLDRAARAFESQAGWRRAPRVWLPASSAALVLLATLAWLVGWVLVPATTGAAPDDALPASLRLVPLVSSAVAVVCAAAAVACALFMTRLIRAGAPTMAAHMLATADLSLTWPHRLLLASLACGTPDLASAGRDVAAGSSLSQALASSSLGAACPLLESGSPPEAVFSAIAHGTDARRLRLAASLPAALTWTALPLALVLVVGTVLGVVVPLLQLVRP